MCNIGLLHCEALKTKGVLNEGPDLGALPFARRNFRDVVAEEEAEEKQRVAQDPGRNHGEAIGAVRGVSCAIAVDMQIPLEEPAVEPQIDAHEAVQHGLRDLPSIA